MPRVSAPLATRSSGISLSVLKRRIDSTAPSTASGGMMALTREPSLRRASTIGLDSSTRRPTWETILSMMRNRCAVVVEAHVGQLQQSLALHVDLLVAVHQDVGDGRVLQQRFERSQAEDFVQHLMADALLFGGGEQVGFLLHHGQDGLPHFGAYAVVIDAGEGLQVDALQQLAVQGEFQLLVFGLERGVGWPRCAAGAAPSSIRRQPVGLAAVIWPPARGKRLPRS